MAEKINGSKVLSGTWGELWLDGLKVIEFKKIEIKISTNREDVQIGLSIDSKMTGLKGEVTVTTNKVYSRYNDILEKYKQGKDVRSQLITKLADPDAVGGQEERYSVDNVWWNDLPIFTAEIGGIIESELTGGFTPSDLVNLDQIKVQ